MHLQIIIWEGVAVANPIGILSCMGVSLLLYVLTMADAAKYCRGAELFLAPLSLHFSSFLFSFAMSTNSDGQLHTIILRIYNLCALLNVSYPQQELRLENISSITTTLGVTVLSKLIAFASKVHPKIRIDRAHKYLPSCKV
jgi:hypothetical protein